MKKTFSASLFEQPEAQKRACTILSAYILLQPALDVLTSLGAQAEWSVTLGTVIRPLFMLAAFLYVLFSGPFPGRKPVMVFLGLITGYLVTFSLWNLYYGGLLFCIRNLAESMKLFFFPYAAALLYTMYRQNGFVVSDRTLALAGGGYAVVIFLAFLTHTSFVSYNAGYGYCGWFFSANDVSILIMLTSPVVLCLCLKGLAKNLGWKAKSFIWLLLISLVFSAAFIGTKLVYLGVCLYLLTVLCWLVIRCICLHKKQTAALVTVMILLALLVGLYPVSPLNRYVKDIYIPMSGENQEALEESLKIPGVVEKDREKAYRKFQEAAEGTWLGDKIDNNALVKKLNWALSNRLLMIAPIAHEYEKSPLPAKILGLGYSQHPNFTKDISHLVEMEGIALLLRHGILGLCLYYLPFLAVTGFVIVSFLRRLRKSFCHFTYCSLMFSVLMACAASLIVGHVLQTPSVSMLVAVIYEKSLILSRCDLAKENQPF